MMTRPTNLMRSQHGNDLISILLLFLFIATHQLAYIPIRKVNALSLNKAEVAEFRRFSLRTLIRLQVFLVAIGTLVQLAHALALPIAHTIMAFQVLWLPSRQLQRGRPTRSAGNFVLDLVLEILIAGMIAIAIGYALRLFA
jgi:hypothetical protein